MRFHFLSIKKSQQKHSQLLHPFDIPKDLPSPSNREHIHLISSADTTSFSIFFWNRYSFCLWPLPTFLLFFVILYMCKKATDPLVISPVTSQPMAGELKNQDSQGALQWGVPSLLVQGQGSLLCRRIKLYLFWILLFYFPLEKENSLLKSCISFIQEHLAIYTCQFRFGELITKQQDVYWIQIMWTLLEDVKKIQL